MAVVVSGNIYVNGVWIGSTDKYADGTVINIDYLRPNRIEL